MAKWLRTSSTTKPIFSRCLSGVVVVVLFVSFLFRLFCRSCCLRGTKSTVECVSTERMKHVTLSSWVLWSVTLPRAIVTVMARWLLSLWIMAQWPIKYEVDDVIVVFVLCLHFRELCQTHATMHAVSISHWHIFNDFFLRAIVCTRFLVEWVTWVAAEMSLLFLSIEIWLTSEERSKYSDNDREIDSPSSNTLLRRIQSISIHLHSKSSPVRLTMNFLARKMVELIALNSNQQLRTSKIAENRFLFSDNSLIWFDESFAMIPAFQHSLWKAFKFVSFRLVYRYGSEMVAIDSYTENNVTLSLAAAAESNKRQSNKYWLGLASLDDLRTNTLESAAGGLV